MEDYKYLVFIALCFLLQCALLGWNIKRIYIERSQLYPHNSKIKNLKHTVYDFFNKTANGWIAALVAFPFIVFPVAIIASLLSTVLSFRVINILTNLAAIPCVYFLLQIVLETGKHIKEEKLKIKIRINRKFVLFLFIYLEPQLSYSLKL